MVRVMMILPALLALAACGGGSNPRPSSPTSHTPSALGSSSPTVRPHVVTATERQDGTTLRLRPGARLRVVLASTYWQFASDTDTAVLRRVGRPEVHQRTTHCVPGGGCGTVTAIYVAEALGRSLVVASRTSCGEAMGCTGSEGRYRLVVVVAG